MRFIKKRTLAIAGIVLGLVLGAAAIFIWSTITHASVAVQGTVLSVSSNHILLYQEDKGLTSFSAEGVEFRDEAGEKITAEDIRPGDVLLLATNGITLESYPSRQAHVYRASITGQVSPEELARLLLEASDFLPQPAI